MYFRLYCIFLAKVDVYILKKKQIKIQKSICYYIPTFLVLRLLEGNISCMIQQPKRGEAAAASCCCASEELASALCSYHPTDILLFLLLELVVGTPLTEVYTVLYCLFEGSPLDRHQILNETEPNTWILAAWGQGFLCEKKLQHICFFLCMEQKWGVCNKLCLYPNLSAKSKVILAVLKGQAR